MGGSITYGSHASTPALSYVGLTHAWIPTQKVGFALENTINAGIGGTSSWYGLIRLQTDVLAYSPKVICLDWIANDSTTSFWQRSGEALVRRIRAALPDAKIVFLGFTGVADVAVDDATNTRPTQVINWKAICAHYGIAYIDYAAALYQKVNVDGEMLSDYMYDTVHPTDAGHQLAHELVRSTILNAFTGSLLPALPARLYDCEDFEAAPIDRTADGHDGVTGTWSASGTDMVSSEANATISFTDTFVSCGLAYDQSGVIQYSLDGGAYSSNLDLTAVGRARELITSIVAKVEHTFTVKVISGTVTIQRFLAI
ncbi:MAG: SGNH/GDSL hydrolase family protein [Gallionella sp.]|jgi:lysophospholipase L1-like esterase